MSRPLVLIVMALLALAGCASSTPTPVVHKTTPAVATIPSGLQRWLSMQASVANLENRDIKAELADMNKPETADGLFHFGLLNQRSQTYNGWIQARDIFRQLSQDVAIPEQQRQLAGILEEYNQNRINWHQRCGQLQQQNDDLLQQLLQLEQEKQLLEQKIQAITDLESAISTRKEP